MAPKLGSRRATVSMKAWGSRSSISMSMLSIPANFLKRTALPSITGLLASAPMAPRPSTAVPLVMTATILPRAVYSHAMSGFLAISSQAAATPGE